MVDNSKDIPLRTAALITGITIFIMAIMAPIAELYIYPKLVVPSMAAQTFKNISANKLLFTGGMLSYALTDIGDIIVAWALYLLLRPVSKSLSLLTALFRLVYSVIAIIALLNLVTVFRMTDTSDYTKSYTPVELYNQVTLLLGTFKYWLHFGILFFAIHLVLSGFLAIKAKYIPSVMGVFLIITGLGYFLDALRPFLFPQLNLTYITITFFGELIFMFWLLIRGNKIQEPAQYGYV